MTTSVKTPCFSFLILRVIPMRSVLFLLSIGTALLIVCLYGTSATAQDVRWIEDTYADFADGQLDEGGQNIYVSHNGAVRTINRFDLNSDGHLDLLFNCTHDTYQMLPATVGAVTKDRQCLTTHLAVEGSLGAAVGDLDRDGYQDLVICPNGIGVHHDRRFVSIAWGGKDGWSNSRITSGLPINVAARVEIVDLNADSWPDIAVLGGPRWMAAQPEGRIIRVFWGGSQEQRGFTSTRKTDYGVPGAVDMAAADFDADGSPDLAVLCSDARLKVLWAASIEGRPSPVETELPLPLATATCVTADMSGILPDLILGTTEPKLMIVRSAGDRMWKPVEQIAAVPATHVAVGNLDRSRLSDPELVLTQFSAARAAGGEQAGAGDAAGDVITVMIARNGSYDIGLSVRLSVPFAVATAVEDLDGDRDGDIAVAVHQGDGTFGGRSVVFFSDGSGTLIQGDETFPTSGTTGIAIAPAEHDLPARIVFCNSIGGRYDEEVPLHVYLGGPDGFDPEKLWKIPFQSGYESTAADLDADGLLDLLALNSGHSHTEEHHHADLGANIYWGGETGIDPPARTSVIHEHYLGSSSAADLNRDGWLDLVLEPFAAEEAGKDDELFIYYGGADGFPESRRVVLPKPGYSQEHVVADFNRDEWLDIAHTSRTEERVRILWGGKDGYSVDRSHSVSLTGALGLDAADLNADGWLDLYVSTYADPVEGYRDLGSVIFWGGPKGYRHSNAQWLPGFSPLGRCIADFDGDGFLDLFSPQHSGELTRESLACHIYWGSADGFHTRRRSVLYCDSVNDSLAGDFNSDGRIDLAVACHTQHGNHRVFSRVFYNDGARFENARMQKLPTNGTHLMWALDIGHIATRKYEQTYDSSVFEWQSAMTSGTIKSEARVGAGETLEWLVRSAATPAELEASEWRAVQDNAFTLQNGDRALQYRAVFRSDNGDRYPTLDKVEITLSP